MSSIRWSREMVESLSKLITAQEVNGYEVYRPYDCPFWVVQADEKCKGEFYTRWGAKRYAKKLPYYKNKHKIAVEKNEQTIAEKLLEFYQECYVGLIGHYVKIEPCVFDQDVIIRVLPKYEKIPQIVPISNNNELQQIEWERNDTAYFCKLYVMEENYKFFIDACRQVFNRNEIVIHAKYSRWAKESDRG